MNDSSWLDKLLSDPVVIATLVLALVTAILAIAAFKSIRENRRIREEDRERELKRHAIEFIYDWASQVCEVTLVASRFADKNQLFNIWQIVIKLRVKGFEVKHYSNMLDAESKEVVRQALNDFTTFTDVFTDSLDKELTTGRELMNQPRSKAYFSVQTLVVSIADLRMKLQL